MNKTQLRTDIEMAINRNSAENGSDTPDFILAEYLMNCLDNFDKIVHARSAWYSHHCHIGGCDHTDIKSVEPAVKLVDYIVDGKIFKVYPLGKEPPNEEDMTLLNSTKSCKKD